MRWDEMKLLVLSMNPITCWVYCLTSGLNPAPSPQRTVGLSNTHAWASVHTPMSLPHTTHQPGGHTLSILFTCCIFILPPVYPVGVTAIKDSAHHTSPLQASECYLLNSERKGSTSMWVSLSGPLIVSIGKSQGKNMSFLVFPES